MKQHKRILTQHDEGFYSWLNLTYTERDLTRYIYDSETNLSWYNVNKEFFKSKGCKPILLGDP